MEARRLGNSAAKVGLIWGLAALSGCVQTRYVTVHCLTPVQYETLKAALPPKIADRLTGDANADIKIIAASSVRLRGYAGGLLEVLEGCVGK